MTAYVWRRLEDGDEWSDEAYEEAIANILGPDAHRIYDGTDGAPAGGTEAVLPVEMFPPGWPESVVELSLFLELPFDLGVPSDKCFAFIDERHDRFGSWSAEAQEAVAGIGSADTNTGPTDRLVVRRARIRDRLPLVAVDRAFGAWLAPYLSAETLDERHSMVSDFEDAGISVVKTVLAYTQWFDTELWPPAAGSLTPFLNDYLEAAIEAANRLIVAVAIASQNDTLYPVTTGDLPAAAPYIARVISPNGDCVATTDLIPVNAIFPCGTELLEPDEFLFAHFLNTQMTRGDTAFSTFYSAFIRAMNNHRRHQWSDTVISMATAVEVFIYTVLREVLRARGETEDEIEQRMSCGFTNLREHHLVPAFTSNRADVERALQRWQRGGYQTRNKCVHKGHQATAIEADASIHDTAYLFAAITTALRANGLDSIAADFGINFEIGLT